MNKGSETKQELAAKLGVKPTTLVSRMRRLNIKAEGYVDLGRTKVAFYSKADCSRLAKDVKERPVLGRGWIKGKPRRVEP